MVSKFGKIEFYVSNKQCFIFILFVQLSSISLHFFLSPSFAKPILKVFGKNLTSLELKSSKVDMELLGSYCAQLKHLTIHSSSSDEEEVNSDTTGWTPEDYLPLLTELRSNVCLGSWASLLERKSTLIHLQLNCCHIGTSVYYLHINLLVIVIQ